MRTTLVLAPQTVRGMPARAAILSNLYRMPPLGVTIADVDAIAVIDAWIPQTDVCVVYPDSDGDMWRDNVDNCPAIPNPDQADDDGDGT